MIAAQTFTPRWQREGWRPIADAPWNDGREYRVAWFSGERLDWQHTARRGLGSAWSYAGGVCLPTHFKEAE